MTPAIKRISIAAITLVFASALGGALYLAWPRADPAPTNHASLLAPSPRPAMSLPGTAQAPMAGDMSMLAERLATRLRTRDTQDGEGWALLGRSYAVLGRNDDALAAFERARRLLGESDVQLSADYAAARNAANVSRRAGAASSSMPAR